MATYRVYNKSRTIKAEIPELIDALRFIRDNNNGEVYFLEMPDMKFALVVTNDKQIKKQPPKLVYVEGGKSE